MREGLAPPRESDREWWGRGSFRTLLAHRPFELLNQVGETVGHRLDQRVVIGAKLLTDLGLNVATECGLFSLFHSGIRSGFHGVFCSRIFRRLTLFHHGPPYTTYDLAP